MNTDCRALCAELIEAVLADDSRLDILDIARRARAALAEPVGEGPTEEELLATLDKATADFPPRHPEAEALNAVEYPLALELRKARAVLARFGHQPAPPVEGGDCPACEGVPKPGNQPCAVCGRSASSTGGEVAELAWWLRSLEDASVWFESGSPEALKLTRAADLLEQRQTAPVPVPVAERLPGPEDCDGEGRCWFWQTGTDSAGNWGNWELCVPCYFPSHYPLHGITHWLPATALPRPAGEVGELVAWLRETGDLIQPSHLAEHQRYKRAADLLERLAAPVPVAERLPDTSDPAQCRMPDGDCWWFDPHADGAWYMDTYQSCYTHWLPFHALPLPSGGGAAMTTPNRPPLWQVMWVADTSCASDFISPEARAIIALRDWLVPEEGPRPDLSHAGTRWDERQRLRALLTAEADRAERGDG